MERTFEAALVEQCAPTLAGVKPASLFRWQGEEACSLLPWARELAPFGIALRVLKTWTRTGACLIYLYRAGWLRQILAEPSVRAFLQRMGYRVDRFLLLLPPCTYLLFSPLMASMRPPFRIGAASLFRKEDGAAEK